MSSNVKNATTPSGTHRASELISVSAFEKYATEHLPKTAIDYYNTGCGDQLALNRNRRVMQSYLVIPRVLRDVSKRDLSVTILNGKFKLSMPIIAAPSAAHGFAHTDGEVETAKGCQAVKTLMILSGASSKPLEEVARGAPDLLKFQNIYVYHDRHEVLLKLMRRAEAAGFKGFCVSIDIPALGLRHYKLDEGYLPIILKGPHHEGVWAGNFPQHDTTYYHGDPSATWADIRWIQENTSLPVIVKGVLCEKDALMAVDVGVAGIVVSNHGGRQLDCTPSAIEVLPGIVKAVAGRCDIFVDGGFRNGSDIFKAIAMGAKAVLIGRPVIWGLASKGAAGVQLVFEILRNELDTTLTLAGCF